MPPFLLASPTYEPTPWYFAWLETMPASVLVVLGLLAAFIWLLKKPIEEFAGKLFDLFVERTKRSSKEPASGVDLARKAQKAIVLEQAAERLRLATECDHVSVYGIQNGEYLRSGEGIDKFVMQAEAVDDGLPRYIDTERLVFANDIPRTVLALENQPYLLLWAKHCDDWKVNKLMQERGYDSSLAVFVRRPLVNPRPDGPREGVIGMYVLSWRDTLLYTHHQEPSLPKGHANTRLLDTRLEALLLEYAATFSYTM